MRNKDMADYAMQGSGQMGLRLRSVRAVARSGQHNARNCGPNVNAFAVLATIRFAGSSCRLLQSQVREHILHWCDTVRNCTPCRLQYQTTC